MAGSHTFKLPYLLRRSEGLSFNLIILHPSKFAESQSRLNHANCSEKDINLLTFKILRTGLLSFTFSHSGFMNMDLLPKIVTNPIIDSG